jgi:hypothetical protein
VGKLHLLILAVSLSLSVSALQDGWQTRPNLTVTAECLSKFCRKSYGENTKKASQWTAAGQSRVTVSLRAAEHNTHDKTYILWLVTP